MKFDHSFKHHDVSQALMEYMEQKMQKLARYEIKPGTAHITYDIQKGLNSIEVNLMGGDCQLKVHQTGRDWYALTDQVVNKLLTQMKKHKNIVKSHRHPEKSKHGKIGLLNDQLEMDFQKTDRMRRAG